MKFKKLSSLICLIAAFMITLTSVNAFAASNPKLIDLSVSSDNISIEYKGQSKFVTVIAKFDNNTTVDVSESKDVTWNVDNSNVVVAYEGRILAQGKGSTVVTASYNGISKKINVTVTNGTVFVPQVLSASALEQWRTDILNRASYMLNYPSWTPTQDLIGWNYVFKSGTHYNVLPYTQSIKQVDTTGFNNSVSNADFYNYSVSNSGTRQPMYGNDCSGFVGFAWGISPTLIAGSGRVFNTTYIMNNYKKLPSLSSLQPGDVLVNSGHTFLVGTILGTTAYCYELFMVQ